MPVETDIGGNTRRICEAIERAAEADADILLTPEGSLSGLTHVFDSSAVRDALEGATALAREKGVGLGLGTCFVEDDGKCYNQIRFYRPDGRYLGFHSKILRCGNLDVPPTGEINHFATSDLRVFSWDADVTIGGLICNDMWANPACTPMPDPHLTRQLSSMGADVIFHAVNGGRDGSEWSEVVWHYHESNLRMRACAGRLWIVTVDNCRPLDIPCSAPSGVLTPRGHWGCRTEPKGRQFFAYTIDLADDGQQSAPPGAQQARR